MHECCQHCFRGCRSWRSALSVLRPYATYCNKSVCIAVVPEGRLFWSWLTKKACKQGLRDYCWYWGAAVHWGKHGFQHVLWHIEAEDDALPSETVFQHNHPKHTAKMTTALLLKVRVMEWPSMSPDLNPIEHMWGILKRKVEKHHVSNIQQLRDVIMEEWKRMPATTCAALVNSMPRRIKAVLDNNGAPTKYWHFGHSFVMFT